MSTNFPATGVGLAIAAAGVHSLGAGAHVPVARDVMIDNRGAVDAYIRFGDASVTVAAATGMRVPPGAMFIFGKSASTHVAVAVNSGAPSLVVHLGEGA